ncbi:sodium/proline symporter [Leucobacter aridicollis]|uniref:sodium/proline symporter n=1 Tax=Leucobacter aridicollis TaxID=283878 RepID=UPI002104AE3C|nr:sodium/proline symporter [Leucobacter aridicollis]UTX53535.1 sodium/proline symporter [Leucobacter aridicollis]
MKIELWFLIIYFVAMAGIGVWAMRRSSKNAEGFLLAGRSLGPGVTALRLQSSSMSGYMFLGAGSLGYTQGYFGMWYALGDIGGGVLNLSVLGRRMRKLSQILGSITSIEYLEHRYPSKWVRMIAAPVALFCMFFYVMAQFIAGGRGLEMVSGISYPIALAVAIGVIVLYTFLGGYLAVAYTDFVQAIIMLVGMVWILIGTLTAIGGFSAGNAKVGAIDETLLGMFGSGGVYDGQWGIILGALLIFSIGYMGWPHVVVSHMAMKRPSVARRAGLYSTLFNLVFIPAPYIVGIFAIVLLPNLVNPELAIFEMASNVLPSFAVGIVMAAIMSTADALLLQSGTVASQDIYARFFNKNMTDKQMVLVSRVIVLTLAIVGYLIAVVEPPAVAAIVIFSTTVLGSAFVPSYVCAVWWKKANTVGAISSMITGTVLAVGWELAGFAGFTGLDPMVVGILGSTVAMIVGSLATQRSHPVPEHIARALDETKKVGPIPAKLLLGQDSKLSAQAEIASQ